MAYCSIDEAFPVPEQTAGYVARKEERRRAKQCKGPALSFLKGGGDYEVDVDRQQFQRKGAGERLGHNNTEGFTSVAGADYVATEKNVDVIGQRAGRAGASTTELPKLSAETPSYFGKSVDDVVPPERSAERAAPTVARGTEAFADFSKMKNDNPGYQLNADFLGSFGAVGLDASSGKPLLGTPNLNDAWKPLTGTGARTSFFEELPWPSAAGKGRSQGRSHGDSDLVMTREEKEMLLKRIDLLFAKLERLEGARNENAQSEIALFVISGLFLMFGLDVVRRSAVGM